MAIPITLEQPGVATRIAEKNTGLTLPFTKLTSDRLATLLREVFNNPVYRDNARKFQHIISKTNGLSLAADIAERSFGVREELPDSNIVGERTAGILRADHKLHSQELDETAGR